jgi:hypothetical protein
MLGHLGDLPIRPLSYQLFCYIIFVPNHKAQVAGPQAESGQGSSGLLSKKQFTTSQTVRAY